jgi:hypothetical protein
MRCALQGIIRLVTPPDMQLTRLSGDQLALNSSLQIA